MSKKYQYYKNTKRQAKNPFHVIVDPLQHTSAAHTLVEYLAICTENLVVWARGNEDQQAIAEWLITQPEKNQYGAGDRNPGEHNSPLMALSGAVAKLISNGCKPGSSDLSKHQMTNLKRVLKGLNQFDSRTFVELEFEEVPPPGLGVFASKLKGKNNTSFNQLFELRS